MSIPYWKEVHLEQCEKDREYECSMTSFLLMGCWNSTLTCMFIHTQGVTSEVEVTRRECGPDLPKTTTLWTCYRWEVGL